MTKTIPENTTNGMITSIKKFPSLKGPIEINKMILNKINKINPSIKGFNINFFIKDASK